MYRTFFIHQLQIFVSFFLIIDKYFSSVFLIFINENICLLFLKCIIDKYFSSVFLIFINEKYLSRDWFCKKIKYLSRDLFFMSD